MSVVFDCADPEVSARFWQALLGYSRLYADVGDGGTDWITIGEPDNRSGRVSFQRVQDFVAPTWPTGPTPQQIHLDLEVDGLDVADEKARAVGARALADVVVHDDETYRVYADPDGHPFCLVQRLQPET
jgi:hypothetical protein